MTLARRVATAYPGRPVVAELKRHARDQSLPGFFPLSTTDLLGFVVHNEPQPEGDVLMAKQLAYADEARQRLLSGVSKLARAVRCTLGPRGRNAVLDKGWGSPNVTKDGVTVAEEIELTDPYENMGAQLVKEAASKTSDVAGDGTTTATVLAEALYREGLKSISAGADPMALTRGIQKGVERVVEELHRLAEKINDKDEKEITEVATIAANNNREIGEKLAEAKIGRAHV